MKVQNFACGEWVEGKGDAHPLFNAVTGERIGFASAEGLDVPGIFDYARSVGNKNLRKMTFHERGRMLKALALHLMDKKNDFYKISYATGATKVDSWIDIEGGIGNLFIMASKGRRELPDLPFHVDGPPERVSANGTFLGQHICVPMEGTALHINAFNFPIWGMLEKLACNLLAGVPAIVKPATATCYLTEVMVKEIHKSNILPEGALQLICGSGKGLLDHVTMNDVVTFTGSAETGKMLKSHPNILNEAVRFNMEADSLNCSILGPGATPDTEEFKIFIKEVAKEITVKAGQKCTAIRRTIVPENLVEEVKVALSSRLGSTVVGDPQKEGVRMGPLASLAQRDDVLEKIKMLRESCELIHGGEDFEVQGADKDAGAFVSPTLLYCENALSKSDVHGIEAFGPVTTLMTYKNSDEAIELAKMGKGSLCGSVITADDDFAKEMVLGCASMHGRMVLLNKDCIKESTGHGSPLAHLVHGGPGRAGGGEEMGGVRGIFHYMQRSAIQGHPTTLMKLTEQYIPGAAQKEDPIHPFKKYFEELEIGETLTTHKRTVTEADIVNFANISGDNFYAHMDETSLEGSLFEKRVAHGYFVISAAAGLFVDPKKGPVLANYGLDELRFTKPVYVGATIGVRLTVKEKIAQEKREDDEHMKGIVKWQVDVYDEEGETVALATILTLVERREELKSF